METVAIIKSFNQANDIKELVDAFILPIKDYSINFESSFTLDEINTFKMLGKKVFLAVNKNIHNSEIDDLKEKLIEIDKLNINGIIYYDASIVKLKKDLDLKTDLIWSQEHMVTNYGTINYWYDKGVKYSYLSSEITKEEINDIKENSKAKLFLNVFGYIPMFTSRRHLVNNYIQYFNLNENGKNKTIYKEEKHYPINDKEHGTTVYSDYILNILDEDFSDIDYLVFNSFLIENSEFKEVLYNFKNNIKEYKFPFNHGFLYNETVYRVKKK
ncbi:MAG: hypothetical protein HFH47_00775 [Bacilli bacterium]|nr:hypothetical protein [Bacilli bacterium]